VVFTTSTGWDFMPLAEYEARGLGPLDHEMEVEGIWALMSWANKHYRMSVTKPISEEQTDRLIARLEGAKK